ncbi:Signal transduction histidine-protein kinase ArlS [compost metagenome]
MENNCKFSENQESVVSISYYKEKTILRFSDQGIGIAEKDIENLFKPFYRGDNKGYAEGNGIGLALSKKIIALHNGEILITSKLNEGTTFILILNHV